MKFNKLSKTLSMTALTAAMAVAPAINVFAAPEDIIDTTKKASLTIHKYDMTAAQQDGINVDEFKDNANGKQDATAETTFADYVIKGVEFTYAKVGEINTESINGRVEVVYDVPKELATILNLQSKVGRTNDKYSSDEINEAMATALVDNTATKGKLEDYIKTAAGATAMPLTDENGVTSASNMPLGLYLLVETKVPANVNTTVDPFFVSLPMTDREGEAWFYDVTVYPKNQTNIPDLDKLVRQHDDAAYYNQADYHNTATVSEGDKIDYILVSHLPKITSKATYLTKYDFTDKISKGLVYQRDMTIYFYDNETDARANNTANAVATWNQARENEVGKFKTTYNAAYDKASQVTISMTAEGLAEINRQKAGSQESEFSGRWIVVAYSTVMSQDDAPILGDTGNTNDVTLKWQRTNMDDFDELEDRARVFTYGIHLTKKFKSDDPKKVGDPTKVNFVLFNKTNGYYVKATPGTGPNTGVYFVTDGTQVKQDDGTIIDDYSRRPLTEAGGTVFTPGANGTFIIKGLEADEYVLTELRTDAGFNLLKEPITINIKCTEDDFTPSKTTLYDSKDKTANQNKHMIETNGARAKATVDGSDTKMEESRVTVEGESANTLVSTNSLVVMQVTNTPGFKLPATGGAGTIAFTVAGCSVAFAGIAIATKKSKKHDEK